MMDDLSRAQWRKSSYSGNSGNCVEIAALGTVVAVRDSKEPDGPVLVIARAQWRQFIWSTKNKHPRPEM
jgi:hypothetical protein